jgi:hypothetical protein
VKSVHREYARARDEHRLQHGLVVDLREWEEKRDANCCQGRACKVKAVLRKFFVLLSG